jgi:type IV pilus assembly protein PilE
MRSRDPHFSKGFTLIDLLIAVAIIGVLMALVAPRLNHFMAKSSQAVAKLELTEAYTAEKTFRQVYKTFHWDLPLTGFIPKGLVSTNYSNALTGSRRRYGLVSMRDNSDLPTDATTLGLTATAVGLYSETWGYGSDPSYCGIVATPSGALTRWDLAAELADMSTPASPRPVIGKSSYTIATIGCPAGNVLPTGGAAGDLALIVLQLDLMTIDEDRTIKVKMTKYK